MSTAAWELVFMMFVLKLPILYLVGVVWWAVRAEPDPYQPAELVPARREPEPGRPPACTWRARRTSRGPSPRRRPAGARR